MSRQDQDDARPRNSRSRKNTSNNDSPVGDIPFRDADPETNEVPLAELDTFVVPGSDERGAGEHIHIRITPFLRRQVRIILSSGRFPYLTEASLIRHAVVRHIYWLVSLRGSIPKHIVPALQSAMDVCRDDEMRIQIENVFQKIDARVSFHMSRGDHMEVIRLLNLVKSRMEGVQPSVWQREFWQQFNAKWAGYLNPSSVARSH